MQLDYPKGWIKLNAEQNGFYRVNYDEQNWRSLTNQLLKDPSKLNPGDRSNLIGKYVDILHFIQIKIAPTQILSDVNCKYPKLNC